MIGNKIDYLTYSWTDANAEDEEGIQNGNCILGNGLIGEELAIDTLIFTIYSRCRAAVYYAPADFGFYETDDDKLLMARFSDDDLSKYVYGTPVRYYHNDTLIGKFFVDHVVKKGNRYTFNCISAVGILAGLKHFGGIYKTGTVGDLIEDLLSGTIEYTVTEAVAAIPVYDGFLPIADKRENLQQILFAYGLGISKDVDGTPHIDFLTDTSPVTLSDDIFYDDGEISGDTPVSTVHLTEHSYGALASDTLKTLFDNTDGSGEVTDKTVEFPEPCHSLAVTGTLTYGLHGDNYAVVSGTGTLTGKEYTHQKKIVTKTDPDATTLKELDVSDATLVTLANSENVLGRVFSFYSAIKTVPISICVNDERPGMYAVFSDPDDELTEGFLQALNIKLSRSTLKARATFIIGYRPTGFGNNYGESVLLTGAGTWTAPDKNGDGSPYSVRLILMQGGQGGPGGHVGDAGTSSGPGTGGAPGAGGPGGKILNVTLLVTPGQAYTFSCGTGGIGGASGTAGTAGTETTFDSLSSATGVTSEMGFRDSFTSDTYAARGLTGELAGGTGTGVGGVGLDVTKDGVTHHPGANGSPYTNYGVTAYGGFGGGAASAGNGGTGQNGSVSQSGAYTTTGWIRTGMGTPSSAIPGSATAYETGWYSSYYFNSTTGLFTNAGVQTGFGTYQTLYKAYGSYCLQASIGAGYWYTYRNDRTGTGPVTTRYYGGGGAGGTGAPGDAATGYGHGGQGGDGGGGGGQSRGYTYGNPGAGGPGGAGGDGADGAIVLYI